jgi:DNA-binding response OmpR family regulator
VKNIREKLRQVGFPIDRFLQTVWGVGYKWEE